MVLIPLLHVICTAFVLVYAKPEGKALIVFSYRLELSCFSPFKFSGGFISTGYQNFLGFSLISRRGVILIFLTTLLVGAQISLFTLMFLRILTRKYTQDYRLCGTENLYVKKF